MSFDRGSRWRSLQRSPDPITEFNGYGYKDMGRTKGKTGREGGMGGKGSRGQRGGKGGEERGKKREEKGKGRELHHL